MASDSGLRLPRWGAGFFAKRSTFRSVYGGRASTKTWTIAQILVAAASGRPLKIYCCREFQKSIRDSIKPVIEGVIERYAYSDYARVLDQRIEFQNGSEFHFPGLERNRESIRGWEGVDIVWVDEAQRLSTATAEILVPTLVRNPGCQLICSWNPLNRTDWIWRRTIVKPRKGDVAQRVSWRDNAWLAPEADAERKACLRDEPDRYGHIWEGEPDDQNGARSVLSHDLVQLAVDAYPQAPPLTEYAEIGLDVADSGAGFNAAVVRDGPTILHWERWRAPTLKRTTDRAHSLARRWDAGRLYYDAGGIGAGVTSHFVEFESARNYLVIPELFGAAVRGKDSKYSYQLRNADFFARRNAQLAWTLRLRAMQTRRLMAGDRVNPMDCLFIRPPDHGRLSEYLAEMTQPTWSENPAGKIEIEKRNEDEPSPDRYDATVLAFANDSVGGLRLPV